MLKKILQNSFLTYLRLAAKIQLLKNRQATIIGITGSSGKTSTKLALQAALGGKLNNSVKTLTGNSETGIPLDLLGLKVHDYSLLDWFAITFQIPIKLLTNWSKFEIIIVEMGIDSPYEPKNMSYLLKIIRPQIGILLNISTVHAEAFDPLVPNNIKADARTEYLKSLIAQEKGKLITSLPPEGYAILNLDDPHILPFINQTKAKIIGFSSQKKPVKTKIFDFLQILPEIISIKNGFCTELEYKNSKFSIQFPHHIAPRGYSSTLAASLASALIVKKIQNENKISNHQVHHNNQLKSSLKILIKNLEKYIQFPPSRSSLLDGINHSKIIDSSYNASPLATLQFIHLCKDLNSNYKIAILGDMREIGQTSIEQHKLMIIEANQVFNQIFCIGLLYQKALESLKNNPRKLNINHIYSYQCANHAIPDIKAIIKSKSLILVKGSQNTIFLEEIVKSLLANPSDKSLLCRQSNYWMNTKNAWFNQCQENQSNH